MNDTLNCKGKLVSLAKPVVMGVLNATPDSFYANSRQQTEAEIAQRTVQILNEGGCMIDIGGCSTRPDSMPVAESEETERLRMALAIVRREAPDAIVSVDTYRPEIARMAVEEYGVDIINDVGDPLHEQTDTMFRMVSRLHVPYIYMSRQSTIKEVLLDCVQAVNRLHSLGQKDIIIDPGFGFGKTLEENFAVMKHLERLKVLQLPILVGISRKSMIYRQLNITPAEALNGTTVLNTIALTKGASILRVHDVREAVDGIKLYEALN